MPFVNEPEPSAFARSDIFIWDSEFADIGSPSWNRPTASWIGANLISKNVSDGLIDGAKLLAEIPNIPLKRWGRDYLNRLAGWSWHQNLYQPLFALTQCHRENRN